MLARRTWLKIAVASGLIAMPFRPATSQQVGSFNAAERLDDRNVVPLEDQLKNGLRTTTPAQQQFVKVVAAYVKQGRLPRAMVNLVYTWAIKRNSRVPFPYFQYALRVLARKRGVNLP